MAYKKNAEMGDDIQRRQSSWLRYLVTTISVLFGILVALGGNNSEIRQIRFVYALAAVLLSLSILALSISMYSELYYHRRRRHLHAEAAKKAYQEKHQMQSVAVPAKKIFAVCEAIGYICFVLALLALSVYVLLRAV